jgi:hypothetical protein
MADVQKNSHSTLTLKFEVTTLRSSKANLDDISAVASLAAEPHQSGHALPVSHVLAKTFALSEQQLKLVANAQIGRIVVHQIRHLEQNLPEKICEPRCAAKAT